MVRLGPWAVRGIVFVLSLWAFHGWCLTTYAQPPGTVEADLNGLKVVFDPKSGSLRRLAYPGVGAMLEAAPGRGSLIDLAYPVPDFEPLRLAPRFSEAAEVRVSERAVEVTWKELGPSRNFTLEGRVAATVRLRRMKTADRS